MNEEKYGVMHWTCGMGWVVPECTLTLEEAKKIKAEYTKKDISARIFMEVVE